MDLIKSLKERPRPEDVAQAIFETDHFFTEEELRILNKAAKNSYKRMGYSWTSSMSQTFGQDSVDLSNQIKAAHVLFGIPGEVVEPEQVTAAMIKILPLLAEPKLDKKERRARGLFKNARWYNKRRRLLLRIGRKLETQAHNEIRNRLRIVSKTSLASLLHAEELDQQTLSLVAYASARRAKRSVFTNQSQESFYDEVVHMLLNRAQRLTTTNWLAVAHVIPDLRVLEHLSNEQMGLLLVSYWNVLEDAAFLLEQAWSKIKVIPEEMVVSRGDDSSTWNEAAGAWNLARAGWLNLVYMLRLQPVIDKMLPGKAMRVMAADVVRWHKSSGKGVHPDTKLWAALPRPWLVLRGAAQCTRARVEEEAKKLGIDPAGWTVPRTGHRLPVAFTPTPELVHGVTVASPSLARALRRCGVFSGQGIRGDVPSFGVVRDEHGAAILATDDPGAVISSEKADVG